MRKVNFLGYTGKFPELCHGVMTLKIDGTDTTFGTDDFEADYSFELYSGGYAGKGMDLKTAILSEGFWEVILPPEFSDIEELVNELFNEEVQLGCCGGCLRS